MNKKYLAVFLGLSLSVSTGVFANTIYLANIVEGYSNLDPGTVMPSLTIDCHIPDSFPMVLNSQTQERGASNGFFMGAPSGTYQCSVEVEGTQYDNGVFPKIVQLGSFKMELDTTNNTAYFYGVHALKPLTPQDNLGTFGQGTHKMERVIGMVAGSENSLVFTVKTVK